VHHNSELLQEINVSPTRLAKVSCHRADHRFIMVNSISSTQTTHANAAVRSAAPKPHPQAAQQKTDPQPSDTVTLKSAGNVDQGGNSH
jgi:hypothetical protein